MHCVNTSPAGGTPEQDFVRWRDRADVHALGRVFDILAPELLIVAAHVANRGAAEDLVQAAFLQAITDGARWDASRPLLPWLVGVVVELQVRVRFDPPAGTPPQLELAVVDPAGLGQDEQALVARTTNDAFCMLPVPAHFAGRDCGLVVKANGYVPSYTVVAVPAQAEGAWQEVPLSPPARCAASSSGRTGSRC
jgi:hypothetical protein